MTKLLIPSLIAAFGVFSTLTAQEAAPGGAVPGLTEAPKPPAKPAPPKPPGDPFVRDPKALALLHERAGHVVDRDTILDRCWGLDYFPESRTLDIHIAKLRKRIEPDPAAPTLIETVRGVGYRFRAR